MNNVGKKILTICVVLALAVTAVLSFYHTIVAPPVEIPPVNSHQAKFLELVAQISTSSTTATNDSLVNVLNDKLKLYKSESLINVEENKAMVNGLISTYAPVFIEQSMNKFNQSVWYSKDHKQMEKMIKLMKAINASVPTNVIDSYNPSLLHIKDIIRNYRNAWSLVNKLQFVSVSDANTKISKARSYLNSSSPITNCESLRKKLQNFPSNMGTAHYRKLEARVNNLRNYRSMSRNEFNNNSSSVNSAINDYANNRYNYGHSPDESTLRNDASSIYSQAQNYYNSSSSQSNYWSW